MSPVSDTDELYGLPLEEFVSERDSLAKRLRQDGDREAADEVKALAKPSRAAWAVNQLMRSQPRARRSLVEAGAAAERATARLGEPDASDELRLAATAGRRVVTELLAAARGLVSADGKPLGNGPLQAVADTFNAALADPSARAAVEEARLTRELRATGFPLVAAAGAPGAAPAKGKASKPAAAKPKSGSKPKPAPARDTAKARREAEKAAQDAAEAKRAVEAVKKARAEVVRTDRELARARTNAEAAMEALKIAERNRDRAQKALDQAEKQTRS